MPRGGEVESLRKQRDELKARLGAISDMRPGSLVERYRRCGKPSCHCAGADAVGHGPSWSLTWAQEGKTITRVIPGSAVQQTREHLAEYRKFRGLARELVKLSERLCDARLEGAGQVGLATAEKGGSRLHSRRRLRGKSKRS